ncbi:MAG: phosphopantetheine-binding protein, partial [Chitinophagaceae bacterium]
IENVLKQCLDITQGVVLAKQDHSGNNTLVGYVVANSFNKEAIITELKTKLPEFMVPTLWVELESLPLTANGKVDIKALPNPDAGEMITAQYVAPRNELEKKLVEIWQELLEVEQVGIHDDFFQLGGHSLLAIRLVSYIERNLLVSLPINVLFQFTTISELSKYLETQSTKNDEEESKKTFEFIDV